MATLDQIAKREQTDRAAHQIISSETTARDEKTARLRAARLEMEAAARREKCNS